MLARGCAELDGAKVKSPIPDYLQVVVDHSSYDNPGHNASYISELRDADPNRVGACLSTVDGVVYAAGDTDVEFTIQSISKAFVYALALEQNGLEAVLERVGVEPSGEAFNELSLEQVSTKELADVYTSTGLRIRRPLRTVDLLGTVETNVEDA